jgi:hypothetical protein
MEHGRHNNQDPPMTSYPAAVERVGVETKGAQRYAVVCVRFDGRRRLFKDYADRAQADLVAARLNQVGCNAVVEDSAS